MRLYGRNSVIERLRTNPRSIKKIYIQHGFKAGNIQKKAQQAGVLLVAIPESKMSKIGRGKNTQGVLMDVDDFEYTPYEDILERALEKKQCIIFLDELNDPQNLGAIIRSAACLGRFSIVLPTHDSVSITETVLRVASGGENYVSIAKVANLNSAIKKAKEEGFFIVGSVVKDGEVLGEVSLPYPLGLVIGSEQKGIRGVIVEQLDLKVTIPMAHDTLSFNAAHAASVLCYEIKRQKTKAIKK